jgi:glycosyltransferase involved in cell wall biosynthesis
MNIESDPSVFSVVIPLIPQHDFELKRLFRTLASEQHLIGEVILCRSETTRSEGEVLRKFTKYARTAGFTKKLITTCVPEVARDGTNRNRGWEIASSPLIAFIDADDLYATCRLSQIFSIFESTPVDAVVHDYSSRGVLNSTKTLNKVADSISVKVKKNTSGGLYLTDLSDKELKLHYAHMTVRNEIRKSLLYTNKFPGADLEFAINLVTKGFNVQYIPSELSAWNRKRSVRYVIRLYKMRILRIFQKSV